MPYLGNTPESIVRAKQDAYKFVATSGQTIFTGADANGSTLTFAPTDFIAVFLNGVRLIETDDYTKSSNTVTLGTGATTGDELIITAFAQVLTIDTYSKTETDAKYMDINAETLPSQSGESGKYLTTDGNTASWAILDTDWAFSNDTIPLGETLTIPTGRQLVVDHLDIQGDVDLQGTGSLTVISGGTLTQTTMKTEVIENPSQGNGLTINENTIISGSVTATSFSGDGSALTGIDSFPSQSGHSGEYLTTNGTTVSWATINGFTYPNDLPAGAVVQIVHTNSKTAASANPVNTFAEVSTDYRVSITPRYSNSKLIIKYAIPMNPTGAANILMTCAPWRSTDGGATQFQSLAGAGPASGSRWSQTSAWFRSSNGYDGNDMQHHHVTAYDVAGTTGTITYGFHFRSEGSNTTYFNYSNGDNSSWGWRSSLDIYVMEIKQ